MKILIIEDEALAAERLETLVKKYDQNIEVAGVAASVEEAEQWFLEHGQPDLAFMDIHLSDGRSFELFEKVEVTCPIIFTTSYDEYALEAFEVNSVDYLLKPLRYEKVEKAMMKLAGMREALAQEQPKMDLTALLNQLSQPGQTYKSRFLVKNGQHIRSIKVEDIAYFYADSKISLMMTFEGRRFPVDYSLDRISEMLDPQHFFRVNRRYMVHFDSVDAIHPYFKGRLKIELSPAIDDDIVVSSDRTPLFKQWLDK
ncbi:LytTR family DNA-binding domain-containing protein [Pontibacter sp. G13]|uniref:LytR/AlgR family response regulator transcription factor n=1 Tax=Pontibacter sp. G13 TaxID=3074898 RepID=UPI0028898247|nr:LytTR family DNA-binding domain-containing protein [Pontibacter sp. G13]WNJ17288.1 LytTR family DNA-binding domain-containing protein [Pontibacter sp. G13]